MRNSYNRNTRLAGATLAMAGLFVSLTLVVPARSTAAAKSPSSGITSLRTKKPADDAANKMRISKAYGNLPMSFEANRGQTDRRVKFLSRGAGYNIFLTQTE